MSKQQFKGRTAAEAAIKACEALGVTRSELKYTLISDTGEAMARLVVIEAEAAAQKPKPQAPVPREVTAEDDAPAAESYGNSSYGYGAVAPARETTSLRHDRGGDRGGRGRPAGRGERSDGRTRGAQGGRPGAESDARLTSPDESRQARSERPERAPRAANNRGAQASDGGGRGSPAEPTERARPRDNERSRRRGNEARGPRGRNDNHDRHGNDGIDSLLQIEPVTTLVTRHPSIDPISPRAKRSISVVADILRHMGMAADAVLVSENEAEVHVHLYGNDESQIIGKKGEVLLALQFVVNRILSRGEDEGEQVVVLDAGGYRERRQKALEELAKTLAERSVEVGKAVRLSPMSAHDRRIFHMVLKDISTVGTRSEGDGLYRHLLIIPAEYC